MGEKGEGSGGDRGGNQGERGRALGMWYPPVHPLRVFSLDSCFSSLDPVVNILAKFSNANILKNKRIKRHIKGIGCQLLILIIIDAWDIGSISL